MEIIEISWKFSVIGVKSNFMGTLSTHENMSNMFFLQPLNTRVTRSSTVKKVSFLRSKFHTFPSYFPFPLFYQFFNSMAAPYSLRVCRKLNCFSSYKFPSILDFCCFPQNASSKCSEKPCLILIPKGHPVLHFFSADIVVTVIFVGASFHRNYLEILTLKNNSNLI